MILTGYAVILGYVFALIYGLGGVLSKRTNTETSRKVIHTMLFMVWVFIDLFLKDTIHQIIIPIIFLIVNALSYKFKFYKGVEREDNNHFGTVFFAAAITVIMSAAYFWKELYPATGIAVFCLTFGDGVAALLGYNFKSPKLKESKSLLGFVGCFAASALSLGVFRLIWCPGLTLGAVVLLAAVAAIMELVGKGMDNFSVTFTTFALAWGFVSGAEVLYLSVSLAVGIFLLVFFSHAITYYGSLLAMVVVFAFCRFGGAVGISFLLGCYFLIFFVGKLRKKKEGKQGRNFLQILINGGLGTVLVIAYGIWGAPWMLVTAMVSIGGNFVDSVSSDVGELSKAKPYDPFRREFVASGISGGMTWLGTLAALAASVAIGSFLALTMGLSVGHGILFAALVFFQTLLDTCIGSLVQGKFRCEICGAETEKTTHCGSKTTHTRGCVRVNNNAVNGICSVVVTALAALLIGIVM